MKTVFPQPPNPRVASDWPKGKKCILLASFFPCAKARKWEKYAAQEFAGVHSSQDNGVSPRRMENDFQASREQGGRAVDGGHGSFQQADSRFTALLAKGNGNAPAARGRGAGVPGPWEAVTMGAREVRCP